MDGLELVRSKHVPLAVVVLVVLRAVSVMPVTMALLSQLVTKHHFIPVLVLQLLVRPAASEQMYLVVVGAMVAFPEEFRRSQFRHFLFPRVLLLLVPQTARGL